MDNITFKAMMTVDITYKTVTVDITFKTMMTISVTYKAVTITNVSLLIENTIYNQ